MLYNFSASSSFSINSIPFVSGNNIVETAPSIEMMLIKAAGSHVAVELADNTSGRKIIANLAMMLQHENPVDLILVGNNSTVKRYITVIATEYFIKF